MEQTIYWKVYNRKGADGKDIKTTVVELGAVMQEIAPDLEYEIEDEYYGYPCINFPINTPKAAYNAVRDELEKRGYYPY